ncbi:hypothetical protein AnigIFM49718_006254 [Aspergillus niger]|nr:hypothetical protein AnigIFM49718_006254 [Aspergillus niger]
MAIDVLPPTMNPTLLAIDGGGVRAGIPLEYLLLIQEALGTECRVRDLGTRCSGLTHPDAKTLLISDVARPDGALTQTGGLLVLGLIAMEWDIATCSETFDLLARRIFRERRQPAISSLLRFLLGKNSILGNIPRWLSWFLHDSCYDPRLFDTSLQEAYGSSRRISDTVTNGSQVLHSQSKFGVIAANIAKDTRSFVFGNFNAVDWYENGYDYELFRASSREMEPRICDVARATAAAPFLFPTAELRVGSFQDGGLQDNFAAGIAGRICRRIWPSRLGVARVISLGTGEDVPSTDRSPRFRHVFRDGFLRRGFDAFMSSLGTKSKWLQLVDRLDEATKPDYIRMDVALDNLPCTIDDLEVMDDYRNLVILQPGSARLARATATAMLVARFYFVLERLEEGQ